MTAEYSPVPGGAMDERGYQTVPYTEGKAKVFIFGPMILNPNLRAYVQQNAEDRPGVYRMLGPGQEILYVGKSIRVKGRLLSYFRADPREKPGKLIRDTVSVKWDYVPNEFSALVREMRLIKRWRPRYNVEHKRKRRFAFIKITQEPAPRILAVSRIRPDSATYFGPFPRPRFLSLTLGDLAHSLRIRDCAGNTPIVFGDQLEIFRAGLAPRCMRAHTKSCLGPCCGSCTSSDYGQAVDGARRFLEGRGREPIRHLRRDMERASQALDYEYAAVLRDRLDRLTSLQRELVAFRGRVDGLSFIYRAPGFRGDTRLYLIRRGLVRSELPEPTGRAARRKVAREVGEVFSSLPPDLGALSQEAASEILLVARWFRLRERELDRVMTPDDWISTYAPA